LKIRFENLIAAVRVLTGALAFFIVIAVGAALSADPLKLLVAGLVVYVIFYKMGSVFAKMLERVNYEVTDIERDKAVDKKPDEKHLGGIIDFKQGAENPFLK